MGKFFRGLKIGLAIIFILGLGVLAFLVFGNYSEGYRSGTIVKFSKKGFLMKTYEGELNIGMIIIENAAANYGSNIFIFSVPSSQKKVIEKIEDVMLTGNRVKLFYKQKYITFPWDGDEKYHIYDIEVLENSKGLKPDHEPLP
jgi:hypothetical protein